MGRALANAGLGKCWIGLRQFLTPPRRPRSAPSRPTQTGPSRQSGRDPLQPGRPYLHHARMTCVPGSWRSTRRGSLGLGHERADLPRPFEAARRARKSTTSATGIAVSAGLCVRLAALPTLRGPPWRYRPRDTRQARARGPPPAAARAQRR